MLKKFAFVLFNSASQYQILERSIVEPLTLIVTLSMMLTPLAFCTDNAAMVAAAAGLRAGAGLANPPAVEADPSLPLVEEPDERA